MGKVEDEAVVADAELQGGQRGGGPWRALGQGPLDDEADEEMGGADVAEVEPTDGADPAAGVGGVGGDEGGNPAVGDVDRVAMGRGRGATETGDVHCGGGRRRTGLGGGAGRAGGRGRGADRSESKGVAERVLGAAFEWRCGRTAGGVRTRVQTILAFPLFISSAM